MPGFNPENINIHDLTIEEPEKEADFIFDPEKEITEKDYDEVKKYLAENEKSIQMDQYNFWIGFSNVAMAMKILNPEVNLNLGERAWQGMSKSLEKWRK